MTTTKRVSVLGLVPARGGSKGVPRKNIRLLCGRPLLSYTANAAKAASRLTRVVLTTDDSEIARIGRLEGLEVPFMRPAPLAADETPMIDVVQHAVRTLAGLGATFDLVALLQPTSPLRSASLIDRCIHRLLEADADSAMTVLPVPAEYNPHWTYLEVDGTLSLALGGDAPIARRQDLPRAYHREGSVYVSRVDVIEAGSLYGHKTVGIEVDAAESVNIDTVEDWAHAERLLSVLRHA